MQCDVSERSPERALAKRTFSSFSRSSSALSSNASGRSSLRSAAVTSASTMSSIPFPRKSTTAFNVAIAIIA